MITSFIMNSLKSKEKSNKGSLEENKLKELKERNIYFVLYIAICSQPPDKPKLVWYARKLDPIVEPVWPVDER